MRERRYGLFAATVLVIATAMIAPQSVWAHAKLLRSDPADGAALTEPPKELRLWFTEEISPIFSTAQLFDIRSQPIRIAAVRTQPDEPNLLILELAERPSGVYSVLWKALSEADGHFSRGLLVFGAGEGVDLGTVSVSRDAETTPPGGEVILRWLHFTLLLSFIGALAVIPLVLVPAGGGGMTAVPFSIQRRILLWALCCGGLDLVVGIGLLFWQTAVLRESLSEGASFLSVASELLFRTRGGTLWLARAITLLASLAVVYALHTRAQTRRRSGPLWLVAGLLLLAFSTIQSLSGHAAAFASKTNLPVVVNTLHLLAASLWVGGVIALAVGLLPMVSRERSRFVALMRAGWAPFGSIAALSVGVLLATGLYNMGREVASLDALITTTYGLVLSTKLALWLAMGAVGLLNAMLLHPRLVTFPFARRFGRSPGWTPVAFAKLPVLIRCEIGLALLVVLATGFITAAPAPRGPEFKAVPGDLPQQLSRSVGEMLVTLAVKPNRPGQNVFTVFAASTVRPPPAEIIRVILRFTYLDEDLGRVSAQAQEVEPGRFLLGGSHLSLVGPWRIEVVVRRKGLEDTIASFDWFVPPAGVIAPVIVSKAPLEALLTIASALMLVILASAVSWACFHRGGIGKAFASRVTNDPSARGGPQETDRMGKYHAGARPVGQAPSP